MDAAPGAVLLAVDPGVTSGFVGLRLDAYGTWGLCNYLQTRSPARLLDRVDRQAMPRDAALVLVEDFVGSGWRNADRLRTIETLGAVVTWCACARVRCLRRHPQVRRPWVARAKQDLPRRQGLRHVADALAHAYSFLDQEVPWPPIPTS